mmetsp:Transcript_38444/g.87333  ORF Transcript_38444/g.87333 Transcript_38444/m.87333 type:complete len:236 (+) Transcript_38444:155-862(+)
MGALRGDCRRSRRTVNEQQQRAQKAGSTQHAMHLQRRCQHEQQIQQIQQIQQVQQIQQMQQMQQIQQIQQMQQQQQQQHTDQHAWWRMAHVNAHTCHTHDWAARSQSQLRMSLTITDRNGSSEHKRPCRASYRFSMHCGSCVAAFAKRRSAACLAAGPNTCSRSASRQKKGQLTRSTDSSAILPSSRTVLADPTRKAPLYESTSRSISAALSASAYCVALLVALVGMSARRQSGV